MTDSGDCCNIGAPSPAAARPLGAPTGPYPMPVMPPIADLISLCRGLIGHLSDADADLAAQQAVRGLDALDEIDLHPVLAAAVESVGCGVLREVCYPGEALAAARPRGRRPRRSERERCDLVLTPLPGQRLADPVQALIEQDRAAGTLFAHLAESGGAEEPGGRQPPCQGATRHTASHPPVAPEDALWLEIKTLGQFCYREGVPGPNPSYTSELVGGPARDIAKLARDPQIHTAAAVVVLFCASEQVARHDLAEAANRWLDKDLPIADPIIDGLPIQDRIGNAWCAVAAVRVRCSSYDV